MHKKTLQTISMLLTAALLLPLVGCAGAPDALPSSPDEAAPDTLTAQTGVSVQQLAAPVYPVQTDNALALPDAASFWQRSAAQFLSGEDKGNRVFSPVSVYLALAMLAETTDGESRAQILSLLGEDSLETLRVKAADLWKACYTDDGDAKVLLGSSLWARDDISYVEQTMQNLAQFYYASVFAGQMGSEAYNKALQSWISEHTGGLLDHQVDSLRMNINTVLSLVTTLYYKAPWLQQFDASVTETDVFHALTGDTDCDYLRESETRSYYEGERFTAVGKELADGSTMFFLLPSEGVTPEELLQDPQALAFLSGDPDAASASRCLVHLKLPKFDVCSQSSLIDGLQALGVTDVFDETLADFSPLTDAVGDLCVTQVDHGTRVKIDEQGCEATAYTMISIVTKGARPVSKEVQFTLDRPFLFGVLTRDGIPLFTGVVHQPAE